MATDVQSAQDENRFSFLRTIVRKRKQASALHNCALLLGVLPGRERDANNVSKEAALADAEVARMLEGLGVKKKMWTTFWFETNSAFGLADSPEAWARIRADWNIGAHGMKPDEIYSSSLSLDRVHPRPDDIPNFGRRSEHLGGKTTLGEFFDANNMDRGINA